MPNSLSTRERLSRDRRMYVPVSRFEGLGGGLLMIILQSSRVDFACPYLSFRI